MHDTAPTSQRPVLPVVAMAALLLSCLVGVGAYRLSGFSAVQQADAPTIATRQLRFEDQSNGGIAVLDARSGALLDTVAPGSNGFLRSTMRGLVRERKRQGLGPAQPFELLGRSDGRLTLIDPDTGRRVDLESFGPTNAAVFARLLTAAPAPSQGADHVAQR
jgi:putative photosynthetic complex assembly protein